MKITKVRKVKTPTRGTERSAGIDFYVPDDFNKVKLFPGDDVLIPSGIKVEVPEGYALTAFNKSGIAVNKKLLVGACIIDEDYQGEIHLHLFNVSREPVIVSPGEKLIQFLLMPIFYDEIEEVMPENIHIKKSNRGEFGFGSTGV